VEREGEGRGGEDRREIRREENGVYNRATLGTIKGASLLLSRVKILPA